MTALLPHWETRVWIYRITHRESGRSYIGITTYAPEIRWAQHRHDAKRADRRKGALHNALHKYGIDAFLFEVIGSAADVSTASEMERLLIAELGTMRPHGFNLTGGGEILPGRVISEETRRTQSEAGKRRWKTHPVPQTEESARNKSRATKAYYAANRRPPENAETRAKKSAANKAIGSAVVPTLRPAS